MAWQQMGRQTEAGLSKIKMLRWFNRDGDRRNLDQNGCSP